MTIQNCFKKVNFIRLEAENKGVEDESNVDRDAEGIWERLQACGLVPETFDFSEYSKSDENIVTRETVTESDILRGIQTNLRHIGATKSTQDISAQHNQRRKR